MNGMKAVRLVLLTGASLLICAALLPTCGIFGPDGLMAKAADLVVAPALADGSESGSYSGSGSGGGGGGSTDCLVCVSVSSTQLGQDIYTGNEKVDSKNGYHMVSMCHTAGGSGTLVTLSVDYDSVPAFMDQGDAYGACSPSPYVNTCAAMTGGTGIWVPSSAVGNNTALDTYFNNIQSGASSGLQACTATHAAQAYRDIHGQ